MHDETTFTLTQPNNQLLLRRSDRTLTINMTYHTVIHSDYFPAKDFKALGLWLIQQAEILEDRTDIKT